MDITTIISLLIAEDWLADDLHYNSFGAGFYEKHLLADRIRDFGSAIDDLKECHFLGADKTTPPNGATFAASASEIYYRIVAEQSDSLKRLEACLGEIVSGIEEVKAAGGLKSGVVAILDSVSTSALKYKFLVSAEGAN